MIMALYQMLLPTYLLPYLLNY